MTTETLTFHVPPQNQGQMVEVSYAAAFEDGLVIRCRHDRSDRTTEYHASEMTEADEGDYWNDAPSNKDWRELTASELRRYGLAE